jgi:adenylate cyclase
VAPDFVLYEPVLLRLRALFARFRHDEQAYGEFVKRYRTMATSLGFQGHIAMAHALT